MLRFSVFLDLSLKPCLSESPTLVLGMRLGHNKKGLLISHLSYFYINISLTYEIMKRKDG